MTTMRHGRLAVVILLAAALAGCTHASARPAARPPSTSTAVHPTTAVAPAPTPTGTPHPDAARTNLLMVLDDYERDGAPAKTASRRRTTATT